MQPDVIYVSHARAAIVTRRGMEGAPDLVVEILSDSTARRDRGAKMHLYARYSIPRYWIVDSDSKTLEIYAPQQSGYERVATYHENDVARVDTPAELEIRLGEIWPED